MTAAIVSVSAVDSALPVPADSTPQSNLVDVSIKGLTFVTVCTVYVTSEIVRL